MVKDKQEISLFIEKMKREIRFSGASDGGFHSEDEVYQENYRLGVLAALKYRIALLDSAQVDGAENAIDWVEGHFVDDGWPVDFPV